MQKLNYIYIYINHLKQMIIIIIIIIIKKVRKNANVIVKI